jgi:hypothetical protein
MLIFKTNQGEKSLKVHKEIFERGFSLLLGFRFKEGIFVLTRLTAGIH